MNDKRDAAANLARGFYIAGDDVFFVNAFGDSFHLRSAEIPAMLVPARVPHCERAEEEDPVLALLAETADELRQAFAEPGIYQHGCDLLLCVSQQVFALSDGSSRILLPRDAKQLTGGECLEALEANREVIARIHGKLERGGTLFRIV